MANSLLFESFRQWRVCMASGVRNACWGVTRIVTGFILGIVSILVWIWRVCCRFVGKYPNVALGGFIVIVFIVWMLTFVKMRTRAVGAEHQRDSIAWQYQNFKTSHGYDE